MSNLYEWHGVNQQGQKVQGEETAINLKNLYTALQDRGITVLKIKKVFLSLHRKSQKISAKKMAEWTRQIAILTQANIDLLNALQMTMPENKDNALTQLIISVKKNIENGMSFAEALQGFPQFFDKIYCGLIQAGEQSGTLGKMLIQLANHQEQMLALRAKIAKSLFYPIVVAAVAALVTTGLLLFVVPQFKNIFNSFNAQLPLFTQMVIQISNALQMHIKTFLAFIAATVFSYHYFIRRFSWFHRWRDRLLLCLPIAGQLITTAISARWTRILATLLTAGLPLIEALQIVEKTIPNQSIRIAMVSVIQQVSAGGIFHQALSVHACFSRQITQMIHVGENAGQLGAMLEKIADSHQASLDHWIDYLSKWLEPAIMMVLAVVTGGLIIAMYLPVFRLGAVM